MASPFDELLEQLNLPDAFADLRKRWPQPFPSLQQPRPTEVSTGDPFHPAGFPGGQPPNLDFTGLLRPATGTTPFSPTPRFPNIAIQVAAPPGGGKLITEPAPQSKRVADQQPAARKTGRAIQLPGGQRGGTLVTEPPRRGPTRTDDSNGYLTPEEMLLFGRATQGNSAQKPQALRPVNNPRFGGIGIPGVQLYEIPGLPPNLPIGNSTVKELLELDRWEMSAEEKKGLFIRPGDEYVVHIAPRKTAGVEEVETQFGTKWLMDTNLAELDPKTRFPKLKPGTPYTTEFPKQRDDTIWRGISWEEMDFVRREGRVESKGEYNIGTKQAGLTFFSSDPEQALIYAGEFQPYPWKPNFERPGYVIRAKRPDDPDRVVTSDKDPYAVTPPEVGVRGSIPVDDILEVWEVRPYAVQPGYVELVRQWSPRANDYIYQEGGRSSPRVALAYRKLTPEETDAVLGRQSGSIQFPEPWRTQSNYAHYAELMPVSILEKYSEYDRVREPRNTPEEMAALKQDIMQHGIRNPLTMLYDPWTGYALLGEGNHRLAIAKELGLTELPVRVLRVRGLTPDSMPEAKKVEGALIDPGAGHVPENLKPSQVFPELQQPSAGVEDPLLFGSRPPARSAPEEPLDVPLNITKAVLGPDADIDFAEPAPETTATPNPENTLLIGAREPQPTPEEKPDNIIAYHGTTQPVDRFDLSELRSGSSGGVELGPHFGTLYQAESRLEMLARRRAAEAGRGIELTPEDYAGMNIIPVRLAITNPVILPDAGSWNASAIAMALDAYPDETNLTAEQIQHIKNIGFDPALSSVEKLQQIKLYLRNLGYDGIRYRNRVEGGGWSYIPFSAEQIRLGLSSDQDSRHGAIVVQDPLFGDEVVGLRASEPTPEEKALAKVIPFPDPDEYYLKQYGTIRPRTNLKPGEQVLLVNWGKGPDPKSGVWRVAEYTTPKHPRRPPGVWLYMHDKDGNIIDVHWTGSEMIMPVQEYEERYGQPAPSEAENKLWEPSEEDIQAALDFDPAEEAAERHARLYGVDDDEEEEMDDSNIDDPLPFGAQNPIRVTNIEERRRGTSERPSRFGDTPSKAIWAGSQDPFDTFLLADENGQPTQGGPDAGLWHLLGIDENGDVLLAKLEEPKMVSTKRLGTFWSSGIRDIRRVDRERLLDPTDYDIDHLLDERERQIVDISRMMRSMVDPDYLTPEQRAFAKIFDLETERAKREPRVPRLGGDSGRVISALDRILARHGAIALDFDTFGNEYVRILGPDGKPSTKKEDQGEWIVLGQQGDKILIQRAGEGSPAVLFPVGPQRLVDAKDIIPSFDYRDLAQYEMFTHGYVSGFISELLRIGTRGRMATRWPEIVDAVRERLDKIGLDYKVTKDKKTGRWVFRLRR